MKNNIIFIYYPKISSDKIIPTLKKKKKRIKLLISYLLDSNHNLTNLYTCYALKNYKYSKKT